MHEELHNILSRNEALVANVWFTLLVKKNLVPLPIPIQANIIGKGQNKYYLFMVQT